MALIERCVRTADRRVPVIAGSGTNSTASSIALSKAAQSAGVDALLTVTPYYNKASQKKICVMSRLHHCLSGVCDGASLRSRLMPLADFLGLRIS